MLESRKVRFLECTFPAFSNSRTELLRINGGCGGGQSELVSFHCAGGVIKGKGSVAQSSLK